MYLTLPVKFIAYYLAEIKKKDWILVQELRIG